MRILIYSFAFGVIQVILLRFLIWSVTKRNGIYALLAFAAKFALYGYAIATFMFKYLGYITYVAFGYIIGMILTAFVIFVLTAFFRKQ